ncbi:MAG: hypothetical protein Q8P41_04800 [Pseudomonadota bacterium]|nr:hypothetical protein [Pseudomonadota bacterium]
MRSLDGVVLGGPNSGKTHYAGQLYGRLRRRPGALSLRRDAGTPPDLSALEEVFRCLENGRAADHTSSAMWADVALPLVSRGGVAVDLRWPDYGGEQLKAITEHRAVASRWRDRLAAAEGWALLVRLQGEVTYPDAVAELTRSPIERQVAAARAGSWDANARLVEMLQLLLHVSEFGVTQPLSRPRLAVLLTCYDELAPSNLTPRAVLSERLPLLMSFIAANWMPDAVSVWGLSSLGRPLTLDSEDEQFIEDGPERQGWVLPPEGGPRSEDLTLPLAWLLGLE